MTIWLLQCTRALTLCTQLKYLIICLFSFVRHRVFDHRFFILSYMRFALRLIDILHKHEKKMEIPECTYFSFFFLLLKTKCSSTDTLAHTNSSIHKHTHALAYETIKTVLAARIRDIIRFIFD